MGIQVRAMFKYGGMLVFLLLMLTAAACGAMEEPSAPSELPASQEAYPQSSQADEAPPTAVQPAADPQPEPWRPAAGEPVVVEKEVTKEVPVESMADAPDPAPQPLGQSADPGAAGATALPEQASTASAMRGEKGDSGPRGPQGDAGATGPQGDPRATWVPAPTPAPEGFNVIGGTSPVNDADYDLTFFQHAGVNPFIDTEDDRLSTFAVDVDTASYTVARRFVQDGNLPDPDSIRVEEFVNFFDQGYPRPVEGAFAIHMEGAPSRFGNDNHWLMRVGLQGKSVPAEERKDASLVFAIDVSGSMGREDRLGLVKKSLRLLVNELRPTDEVGIVVYGSRGRVLLKPTSGEDRHRIMQAINELSPSGSTYVEEGLVLAYGMAGDLVKPGRITQVILLSDGVGNVGRTGADSILRQVRRYVDKGVTLTTVGFGMGNYNDILMERLANDGDGAYYYVDALSEARRIFVDELASTIQVIARDAKVQVEFNPEVVSRYRLLGYENRRVADQDFRNDTVDAGEIGADHSVTALYELKLHDQGRGSLGTVYMRYEDAGTGEIVELDQSLQRSGLYSRFPDASARFQLAAVVAEYAEVLRQSYWAQDGSLAEVGEEARRVRSLLRHSADAAEFAELVIRTEQIQARLDER